METTTEPTNGIPSVSSSSACITACSSTQANYSGNGADIAHVGPTPSDETRLETERETHNATSGESASTSVASLRATENCTVDVAAHVTESTVENCRSDTHTAVLPTTSTGALLSSECSSFSEPAATTRVPLKHISVEAGNEGIEEFTLPTAKVAQTTSSEIEDNDKLLSLAQLSHADHDEDREQTSATSTHSNFVNETRVSETELQEQTSNHDKSPGEGANGSSVPHTGVESISQGTDDQLSQEHTLSMSSENRSPSLQTDTVNVTTASETVLQEQANNNGKDTVCERRDTSKQHGDNSPLNESSSKLLNQKDSKSGTEWTNILQEYTENGRSGDGTKDEDNLVTCSTAEGNTRTNTGSSQVVNQESSVIGHHVDDSSDESRGDECEAALMETSFGGYKLKMDPDEVRRWRRFRKKKRSKASNKTNPAEISGLQTADKVGKNDHEKAPPRQEWSSKRLPKAKSMHDVAKDTKLKEEHRTVRVSSQIANNARFLRNESSSPAHPVPEQTANRKSGKQLWRHEKVTPSRGRPTKGEHSRHSKSHGDLLKQIQSKREYTTDQKSSRTVNNTSVLASDSPFAYPKPEETVQEETRNDQSTVAASQQQSSLGPTLNNRPSKLGTSLYGKNCNVSPYGASQIQGDPNSPRIPQLSKQTPNKTNHRNFRNVRSPREVSLYHENGKDSPMKSTYSHGLSIGQATEHTAYSNNTTTVKDNPELRQQSARELPQKTSNHSESSNYETQHPVDGRHKNLGKTTSGKGRQEFDKDYWLLKNQYEVDKQHGLLKASRKAGVSPNKNPTSNAHKSPAKRDSSSLDGNSSLGLGLQGSSPPRTATHRIRRSPNEIMESTSPWTLPPRGISDSPQSYPEISSIAANVDSELSNRRECDSVSKKNGAINQGAIGEGRNDQNEVLPRVQNADDKDSALDTGIIGSTILAETYEKHGGINGPCEIQSPTQSNDVAQLGFHNAPEPPEKASPLKESPRKTHVNFSKKEYQERESPEKSHGEDLSAWDSVLLTQITEVDMD